MQTAVMNNTEKDLYRILELPPGSGLEEVKAAYRRLAKRYHPDLAGGDSRRFARLLLAYDRLRKQLMTREGLALERRILQAEARRDHKTLLEMLHKETLPRQVLPRLLEALGNTRKISVYTHLRRYFQDAEGPVRRSAVRAVGKLQSAQAAGELEALYRHTDPETRRAIVQTALDCRRQPSYRGILRAAAADEDPEIRQLAAEWAGGSERG